MDPRLPAPLALVAAGVTLVGCSNQKISDEVPDVSRGFTPHIQQVMDNLATFERDPGAWPAHVLIYKGTVESRHQLTGAIGTTTKIEDATYAMTRWEMSALDDPYDIRRVRLLYQWQVGHISFESLEQDWSQIRDRAVLDGNGKPILGPDGRPTFLALPLPVTRGTRRDWATNRQPSQAGAVGGRPGGTGLVGLARPQTVWIADSEGAAQFSLAILSAMANTRVRARWGDAAMMTP